MKRTIALACEVREPREALVLPKCLAPKRDSYLLLIYCVGTFSALLLLMSRLRTYIVECES